MQIFTETISPRLQYIADFLSLYFAAPVTLTGDKELFKESTGVRINYSENAVSQNEVWIKPVGLLFENHVSDVAIETFLHPKGYKAFFATNTDAGFDIFAAIFYLLSRYEEYLPHGKDFYGRYSHTESLAYKEGFLHEPLVNIWLQDFRNTVQQTFSGAAFPLPSFKFVPTYDIDIAWSYINKGLLRNSGGALKSIFSGQWSRVKERISVLRGKTKDPFDSYDWMNEVHQKFSLNPIYFFHVGHQRNSYDKNISTSNGEFQQLIRDVASKHKVGLHPSWHSGDEPTLLNTEKKFLDGIINKEVTCSRQHYIRLTLPDTYQQLLATGITEDYTMGYATVNGFRASMASSFYWYDLQKEEATRLLLHPFCYMDANSFFEQKLTADKALHEMLSYYHQVKKVGGTLITIWHNPFLGKDKLFEGWKEKYTDALETITG